MKTVYLAGPMVFFPDASTFYEAMKAILARHDLLGVAPTDAAPPVSAESLSRRLFRADVALIHRLDAALFDLDPFRGAEMDTGTAFEAGYACALGKPIAGWTTDPRSYLEKVQTFEREHFDRALASPIGSADAYDHDGNAIEDFGLGQNLMVAEAILSADGLIAADADWRVAVATAAQALRQRLS